MTWQPVSFVEPTRQSSIADLDFSRLYLWTSEGALGPVNLTFLKPKPSLPPPLDYHPTEALALREAMIRDRQAAMQRRDMRAVNQIESDLRDVTRAMLRGV